MSTLKTSAVKPNAYMVEMGGGGARRKEAAITHSSLERGPETSTRRARKIPMMPDH